MKKNSTTSIQEHAGKIRELADRLTHLDDTPSDSLLVAVLMLSLPSSYSSLIISLDSHSSKNDFDFVVQHCMNEEARQAGVEATKQAEHENRNEAFLTDAKPRRDRKDITCFKCGKKGHYRNECPETDEKVKAEEPASAQTVTLKMKEKEEDEIFTAVW
ncbi:hypothetical protein BJ912DRAFT_923947 [Pholiota molesta]|nr:hypothetical protein BJ912DRAFT_923947 [Pholiota molesta]